MSWGTRIAILYLAFVAMIGTLVFLTMKQDVDLVSPDYYQREINYQQQLDRMNASNSLETRPEIKVTANGIQIKFPEEMNSKRISGEIEFYRASDATKDFTEKIVTDSSATQMIGAGKYSAGLYAVKLTWSAGGNNYYDEIPLYIP
jgi:hypothetical protein